MTIKPTVAEFFAQYAKRGHIFPDGGLRVKCRDRDVKQVTAVLPEYHENEYERILPNGTGWGWYISGRPNPPHTRMQHDKDIIAILDEAGNVIAGEV